MTINEYLKKMRIRSGLSQKQVAKRMGYNSGQFVYNIENGYANPPLCTIVSYCNVLGMRVKEQAVLKRLFIKWYVAKIDEVFR